MTLPGRKVHAPRCPWDAGPPLQPPVLGHLPHCPPPPPTGRLLPTRVEKQPDGTSGDDVAAPALSQPWRPGRGAVAGLTTWGWPVSLPSTKTQAWAACPGSSWECGAGWAALRPRSHLRLSVCPQAPPPPKRAPTTALTLRSKSMTSELEELGKSRPSGLPCRQHVASMKPSPCMALCLPACPPPRPSLGIAPGAPLAASSSRWHPRWNPVAPGCGY